MSLILSFFLSAAVLLQPVTGSGWKDVERGVKITWNLEGTPLQIKTDSTIASDKIWIMMYDKEDNYITYVAVKFSSLYKIGNCVQGDWAYLPVPVEVEKIWTITKTETALTITCNDVEVLNYFFTESSNSNCVPKLGGHVVDQIEFSTSDTASDFYKTMPTECPAFTVEGSTQENWAAQDLGTEITITCKHKHVLIGDEVMTCQSNGEWSDLETIKCIRLKDSSNMNMEFEIENRFKTELQNHRSKIWKGYWVIILLLMTGVCAQLVYELITNYLAYDSYNLYYTNLGSEYQLPSITICNLNVLDRTELEKSSVTVGGKNITYDVIFTEILETYSSRDNTDGWEQIPGADTLSNVISAADLFLNYGMDIESEIVGDIQFAKKSFNLSQIGSVQVTEMGSCLELNDNELLVQRLVLVGWRGGGLEGWSDFSGHSNVELVTCSKNIYYISDSHQSPTASFLSDDTSDTSDPYLPMRMMKYWTEVLEEDLRMTFNDTCLYDSSQVVYTSNRISESTGVADVKTCEEQCQNDAHCRYFMFSSTTNSYGTAGDCVMFGSGASYTELTANYLAREGTNADGLTPGDTQCESFSSCAITQQVQCENLVMNLIMQGTLYTLPTCYEPCSYQKHTYTIATENFPNERYNYRFNSCSDLFIQNINTTKPFSFRYWNAGYLETKANYTFEEAKENLVQLVFYTDLIMEIQDIQVSYELASQSSDHSSRALHRYVLTVRDQGTKKYPGMLTTSTRLNWYTSNRISESTGVADVKTCEEQCQNDAHCRYFMFSSTTNSYGTAGDCVMFGSGASYTELTANYLAREGTNADGLTPGDTQCESFSSCAITQQVQCENLVMNLIMQGTLYTLPTCYEPCSYQKHTYTIATENFPNERYNYRFNSCSDLFIQNINTTKPFSFRYWNAGYLETKANYTFEEAKENLVQLVFYTDLIMEIQDIQVSYELASQSSDHSSRALHVQK
eukprot:sb/3461691/